MRYRRFIIKNYRAITGPLEIRMDKSSLMPIIGVNESGKTTILLAICAFDRYNDDSNDGGRHLKDVSNLYRSSSPPATIEAEIDISPNELKRIFGKLARENPENESTYRELAQRRKLPSKLTIRRTINTLKYTIPTEYFGGADIQDEISKEIISFLPYILYFDDFRDKIPEKIEIPENEDEEVGDWFETLQQLFEATDKTFSLYQLPKMEVRQRKTVLAKVQRHLNDTLTREWQSFRLDDTDALKIHIEFEQQQLAQQAPPRPVTQQPAAAKPQPTNTAPRPRSYLKLEVVETDQDGDEHFFFISDRSKGFYWFFNFVMKLEFNPKVSATSAGSIYLLDEPGSYLHAYAQRKLCLKLRQIAERNNVLYCTHSHYLLDPEVIPINRVTVADKDGTGSIQIKRMIDYPGNDGDARSALQPVLDALQIKPYALDLIHAQTTVIVEGIYDYFCLELFRENRALCVLPCFGADSIKFYIPLMIGWQIDFRALWDNDAEGRKRHAQAVELFGPDIAQRSLRLLPYITTDAHWIMQNLFAGEDLSAIRSRLDLAPDASFERTILALFYSSDREELLETISQETKKRFEKVFDVLGV